METPYTKYIKEALHRDLIKDSEVSKVFFEHHAYYEKSKEYDKRKKCDVAFLTKDKEIGQIEIKITKEDLNSYAGHNFGANINFFCVPDFLILDTLKYMQEKELWWIGLLILESYQIKKKQFTKISTFKPSLRLEWNEKWKVTNLFVLNPENHFQISNVFDTFYNFDEKDFQEISEMINGENK